MAKQRTEDLPPKNVVWLHGEIKTPPFTKEGRQEAGVLIRALQNGETIGMPRAEPLPIVGSRCGALRLRDGGLCGCTAAVGAVSARLPDGLGVGNAGQHRAGGGVPRG